jgi:hypothetical protein
VTLNAASSPMSHSLGHSPVMMKPTLTDGTRSRVGRRHRSRTLGGVTPKRWCISSRGFVAIGETVHESPGVGFSQCSRCGNGQAYLCNKVTLRFRPLDHHCRRSMASRNSFEPTGEQKHEGELWKSKKNPQRWKTPGLSKLVMTKLRIL